MKHYKTLQEALGRNAFICAAADGDLEMLHHLKSLGLSTQDMRVGENQALVLAVAHGHLEVVKLLVSWGLTRQDARDRSVIRFAADNGHLAIVQLFMELDYFTLQEACTSGALRCAANGDHANVVSFFLNWQSMSQTPQRDPGLASKDLLQAFVKAAERGKMSVIRVLANWLDDQGNGLPLKQELLKNNSTPYWVTLLGHVDVFEYFRHWSGQGGPLSLREVVACRPTILAAATSSGRLETCNYLRDWHDPDGFRLSLDDVRAHKHKALTEAADQTGSKDGTPVLQWLKDWRDDGPFGAGKACVPPQLTLAVQSTSPSGAKPPPTNWADTQCLTLEDLRCHDNELLFNLARLDKIRECRFLRQWGLTPADACQVQARLDDGGFRGKKATREFFNEWLRSEGLQSE